MNFDFSRVKGESAGPDSGHYWADVNDLVKFLDKNPEFSHKFFYDNIILVKKALRSKTRKVSKTV